MVNIGYRAARIQGSWIRSLYKFAIPWIVKRPISQVRKVEVNVFSLSCDRDLPEQVASIRSFIRYVGIPEKFTVVSDGSYSERSCQLLRQIHPCVNIVTLDSIVKDDLPKSIIDYAQNSPMGKKLIVEFSMPIDKATIYVDSDVLFFPDAEEIANLCESIEKKPRYLPDCAEAFDDRIFRHTWEKSNPVNGGFIWLQKPLNWEIAVERLLQLENTPNYFTEQTMLHLTMHRNNAIPLCPNKFILRLDDQFIYADKYTNNKIALRHYVNPVRHKFWLSQEIWK
ncbi:hypothetical protein [Floridanema aerugineum]|jgi:hypothetical protein|uniref:Glycosyltransferase n=1 Tax=Floridaenema aerugineum BLCC-F46 TaxID=3153654 RepID=A0ABV4X521_9CYAN